MKALVIVITISSALLLGSCRPQHAESAAARVKRLNAQDKAVEARLNRLATQEKALKATLAKLPYYVPVKGKPPLIIKAPAESGYWAKRIPLTQLKPEDYGKVFCPKGTRSVVIPEGVVRIPKIMCDAGYPPEIPASYVFIEKVSLPSTLKSIGEEAFQNNKIKELSLPEGLKRIGDYAFHGNELEHVVFPQSLQFIGDGAFGWNQLRSLTLPRRHELIIGEQAFLGNKLKSLVLPGSVELVGSYNFGHNELTKLTVKEGVTTIPPLAFEDNQLKSVTLPSTIEGLGAGAFSGNPPLGFLADLTILARRAPKILTKVAGSEPLPDNLFGLKVTSSKPESDTYIIRPYRWHVKLHVPAGATGYSGPEWQSYPNDNLFIKVTHKAKWCRFALC